MQRTLEELVWRRALGRCEYCQLPNGCDRLPFQIDHVIARQHGGPTAAHNLALACFACNHHKGPNIAGYDESTQLVVPLFNPRANVWSEHLIWEGPLLRGLTSCGNVTLHVLAINLDYRVELRKALIADGTFLG